MNKFLSLHYDSQTSPEKNRVFALPSSLNTDTDLSNILIVIIIYCLFAHDPET